MEAERPQHRTPAMELVEPVGQGALGHEDDVRPADAQTLVHVGQNAYALEGLSQPHLVRQDTLIVFRDAITGGKGR